MRHHAKGVAVITAGVETPAGFCATSLVSVSLEPPLVAFTVGLHAASLLTVKTARHVIVHLLAADQEDIARRFAQPGAARFGPQTRWHRGAFGLPVIDGVLAWMLLVPVSYLSAGDHVLVIGRVIMVKHVTDGEPLIHHNGDFARLAALDRIQVRGRDRNVRSDKVCLPEARPGRLEEQGDGNSIL